MPGEMAAAKKSYLQRVLSDGESTFRYRGRVRTLLGLPDVGGGVMNCVQPLPFAGFAGVRARDGEAFGIPEDLRSDSPPGNSDVPWPMRPDYGNHSLQREAQLQTDGRKQVPTTRRPDALGRTNPMITDGVPTADAFSPSGLNTDGSGAAHSPVRAHSPTSPPKIHQVVVPGTNQRSGSLPHGNVTQLPTPAPAPIPSSADNDAYTTTDRPRSTPPGPSPAPPVLAPPIPVAKRDGDLEASVATSPVAGTAPAAADMRAASDAAARRGHNDEPAHPVPVSRPQPMPGMQPRALVSPAHERPVASLKTSTISALDPVGIHRGDGEVPPRRFSPPGPSAKPGPKAEPPTGPAAAPAQRVTSDRRQSPAHVRSKQGAETGGYASADSAVDQASAVPLPQPPTVVVHQAQGPSAPTPAFWERRHLALWRLRFGR